MYFNSLPISAKSNDTILQKIPKVPFLGHFWSQLVIFLGLFQVDLEDSILILGT